MAMRLKKTKFINNIEELPFRAKVCLYGAGDGAAILSVF